MMRGLYIIVEGQTEEVFVNSSLRPYFTSKGIYDIRAIKIQTSPGHKGGDLIYDRYKANIALLLKQETDILLTSLIDFYKLKSDFPGFVEAKEIADVNERVVFIEKAISEDINHTRLIPYIQLHEFEGLLFAAKNGFEYLPGISNRNLTALNKIVDDYANPELINDGAETHPAKRLSNLIPSYKKTIHGPIIALENGFDRIMDKCPRFKNWIDTLIERMKEE